MSSKFTLDNITSEDVSTSELLFISIILLLGLLIFLPKYHIGTLFVYIAFTYTSYRLFKKLEFK